MHVCMHVCVYVGILCLESIHLSLIHLHDARVYFLYWLGPLGLTDHQPNIYTSQPKYDYEWFCMLMTCTQQWPRSSKLPTLHKSTIFTHEEDLSAFKTLSLCMYVCFHSMSVKLLKGCIRPPNHQLVRQRQTESSTGYV